MGFEPANLFLRTQQPHSSLRHGPIRHWATHAILGNHMASDPVVFLRCRVVVDNVGDHVMPEQSVFCRPDELDWAYVILQTRT